MKSQELSELISQMLKELELVSILAYEVFLFDEEKKENPKAKIAAQELALAWMDKPLPLLFNQTPRDAILNNQSSCLIDFLKAKLGQ